MLENEPYIFKCGVRVVEDLVVRLTFPDIALLAKVSLKVSLGRPLTSKNKLIAVQNLNN